MADDNKSVGSLAAAKLVALIKSALNGKLDKTGGTIFGDLKVKTNAEGTGNIDVEGEIRVNSGTAHLRDVHATGTVHSDLMTEAPLLNLRAPLAEKSVQVTQDGDTAVKMECFDGTLSNGYARLEIGTPTGDNDAATKAYVDGMTHDYYDVTVTSSAGAAQTIDGGIISVRGSADKTVSEISAAYAAGDIVRCIYNGNIMQLVRAADVSYSFSGVGANYGVARSGNITITIMSTSNGDVTLITSAAGELPIPDSDVSQNGCVLVVGNGQWMYSADKFIPATPTSNGLMSAEDKTKLDSIDSVCYDIYAKIGAAYTHDSVYKYGCTVSHTFDEINTAVHAGKTPRVLLVDNIENPSDTRIICPLFEYDTSRSEGGYYFDAPGLVGVSGSGRIYIDENGAMYTCSAGELPAVDANQDGKYLTIDGGMWTYRRPDVATTAEPGFMSAKDKAKLDGIEAGANKTVVDEAIDAASTNPVQNKAVKTALDGKAGTAVATTSTNGLMSKDDKKKLDGVAEGANKTTVIDALDPLSHNPVSSAALFEALSTKADRAEATEQAAGLMSAKDKKKLNGIEDGANKTIVDEMLSDGSTNPVQNKAVTAALSSVVRESIYPIAVTATSAEWTVTNGIAYKEASSDRTFEDIKAAYNANKTPVCEFERMTYSLILDSPTAFIFSSYRGAAANDPQYVGIGKYPTSLITINTTGVVISRTAGDLPAVNGADNDKMLIVVNGEWAMQSVPGATVDTELSTTSENPVQNKTVTDALNGKLPKTGGTVTGALRTNGSFSAGGTISFGEASIGLSQTADGAAEIRYGNADVNDNPPPLSRLKVARPTADDDAATKKYVDDRNDSPQFKGYVTLTPANATIGTGVGLSPSLNGTGFTLDISDVNEDNPTLLTGVKTPTDADTNAAATVEYVKNKVSEVSSGGGVTVDTAMSDTSTNPVQNKTIKQYVDDHAVSLPLVLTYTYNQVTGAPYSEIRKAIESGRQIKLAVANTTDIIASNAKNETNKSVLRFTNIDVGGDTVNIAQYNVTAQESGLTVNVKSYEIAQ